MHGEVKTGNLERRGKRCKDLRGKERESNDIHVAGTLKKGLCGGEAAGKTSQWRAEQIHGSSAWLRMEDDLCG